MDVDVDLDVNMDDARQAWIVGARRGLFLALSAFRFWFGVWGRF